ncbi:MAG: zinc-binding dehydrogenase [Halovenus sp.]
MPTNEVVIFPEAKRVELDQRPMPTPDPGEALIETDRTLVSTGSELALLDGSHQPDNLPGDGFPIEPGYSNVGTVIDVGEAVDEDLVGRRVVSRTIHARYVTADASAIVPVPSDIPSVSGTFSQIAAIAMNAVRRGELAWGESAAVRGLGLVGQLAIRTCLVSGAAPVYGLDLDSDRLGAVPDHGRVEPVHVGAEDGPEPADSVADVVVDATGNPETLGGGVSLIKEDGRFVVVGCPRRTVEFDFYRDCIVPSARIIGSYRIPAGGQGRWDRQAYAELFFEYLQTGDMDVESLVTAEPQASDAPAVFEALLENPTGELGVVFDWE